MSENKKEKLLPWQQDSWSGLQKQVNNNRLPHALLLQGAADSGLEQFALLWANALLCDQLCESLQEGLPCGACRPCHLYHVGTHANFSLVKQEVNDKGKISKVIKVDQIRQILHKIQQTSLQKGRKVLVISPAEAMNPNAANALLKSLEEPPENTFLILVSYNPSRLMATIRSRCQLVDIPLPSAQQADTYLSSVISSEDKRRQLLALSTNNPLLVEKWQEQGYLDDLLNLENELEQLSMGNVSELELAAQWYKSGVLLRLMGWWRWLALQLKQMKQEEQDDWSKRKNILSFMDKLLSAKQNLETTANPNEQLLLESLLIDWALIDWKKSA